MKRNSKFIAGLLGIALLATPVLAGCNGGNGNGSSNNDNVSSGETWEQVKTGDIQAPDYVIVGDEFNLDDYVTIEGGAGPKVFSATVNTVSEGVCTLEGHKGKVLKEGTISIAIKVGPAGEDPLWQGKFSTRAISAIKAAYQDYTKDISKQFMFFSIEQDRNGNYYAEEFVKHTSEYIWFSTWDVEDEAAGTYTSGGIMRSGNGYTHFYEIDSKGETLTVDPERAADFDLYYVTQDFNLPVSEFVTEVAVDEETGERQEYLVADALDSIVVQEFVKYNVGVGFKEQYVIHSIEVYPIQPFDEETYWEIDVNVAYASSPKVVLGVGANLILSTKDEHCKIPMLDQYIADKKEPDAVSFAEVPVKFDALATAKNYTMKTTTSLYYTDPATKQDVTIAGDDYDAENLLFWNNSVETTTVNADSVVTEFKHGSDVELSGYYEEGGKLMGYQSVAGKPGEFKKGEVEGVSGVWAANSPISAAALTTGAGVFEGFRVNSRTENKDGSITFALDGYECVNFLNSISELSTAGSGIAYFVGKVTEANADKLDDKSYWGYLTSTVTIAADYITFRTEVYWEDLKENEDILVYAVVESKITNIGTTAANVLPSGVK